LRLIGSEARSYTTHTRPRKRRGAHDGRVVTVRNYSDPQSNFCLIHAEWQAQGQDHCGIVLIPQYQLSSRLRRWEVRDRLLNLLNQHTAAELRNQLWWLPQA